MKSVLLLILSFVAISRVVRAQNCSQVLPACAAACYEHYIPSSPCSLTDQHCICTNSILHATLTACVQSNCTVKDTLTTQKVSSQACDWPVHDKQPLLRAVTIPFLVVASLFYLARMTARMSFLGGELGPDDYMVSFAYLFTLGFSIIVFLLASGGLGKDIWQVPFDNNNDQVTYTLQLFTALEKVYILAVWFTKISILLLYLRIFPDCRFRTNVRLCLAFCAAAVFCLFTACLFKCWPISFSWTYWDGEHHGSCSSQNAQGWANAGINIVGDLLVLGLPLPTIWRMSLSKGKKLGIMFMFGVGICITIISMIRLYTLRVFTLSENPTWDFTNLVLWSVVEVDVGIICACLPGARNFYSRGIQGKLLGKGRFATGPAGLSRSNSPGSMQRQMLDRSRCYVERSDSAATKVSDASDDRGRKEFILVVNDVKIEERSVSPLSANAEWRAGLYGVETWSVPPER